MSVQNPPPLLRKARVRGPFLFAELGTGAESPAPSEYDRAHLSRRAGENHGTSVIVFQSEEDVRRVVDQPAPETGALTVESVEVGQVVAQA